MTLIASVIMPEISLLLGDARITADGRCFDCCQKVVRLSNSTVMGFAGDVRTAAEFMNTAAAVCRFKGAEFYDKAFSIQELVKRFTLQHPQTVDAFRAADGSLPEIDFVFTGRARPSVPIFQTLHFSLPSGEVKLLTQHGMTLMGSGQIGLEPLAKALMESIPTYRAWTTHEPDPEHYLVSSIVAFFASTLQARAQQLAAEKRERDPSFGIILHGMYVDRNRVTPVEITSTNPSEAIYEIKKRAYGGDYKVRYVNGQFVLSTESNKDLGLVTPSLFMRQKDLFIRNSPVVEPHPAIRQKTSFSSWLPRWLRW